MLMSSSINAGLVFSFPPSSVDLVTDLWEGNCGMWLLAPKWYVISLKGGHLLFSVHAYCEVPYGCPFRMDKTVISISPNLIR